MARETTDILISGGGVAGLAAAAAFGTAGFSVICVDPAPPITAPEAEGADLRTTAFLQPAREVLEDAGLWGQLSHFATPLQVMRLVDAGGEHPEPRLTKDFDASEISDAPFGWNLPNWLLRREMVARLQELPNVSFRPGTATAGVLTRENEALVTLSSGEQLAARSLIGADGRNSPVREALGIPVTTKRYGQKALAFAVRHSIPHDNISTEVHRTGGPFTLVPLPDHEGRPSSAVVWMESGAEALRLSRLPKDAFEKEMTLRSAHVLGPLELASKITLWPIISQLAKRYSTERTALMAEAAHVVPPIGAQGLNMSLADLGLLLKLAKDAPDDLGSMKMLDTYHRQRWPEAKLRVAGVDMLNRAAIAGQPVLRDLRAGALDALHRVPFIRRNLMHAGLGVKSGSLRP